MDTPNTQPKHLTLDEIREGCITIHGGENDGAKVCMMQEEFRQGIDLIKDYKHAVTFYGSAVLPEEDPIYKRVQSIAYRMVKEFGVAVITGGGPGLMEAANRGAYEAGGKSVGATIKLPHEQETNKYVTDMIPFYFFFARKVTLSYTTEACFFVPGGFGTLDELFDVLTLVETKKITPVPIILIGSDFWKPLDTFIKEQLFKKFKTLQEEDTNIYHILDDEDEIMNVVRNAKPRVSF
jgi:uncharacterized protein (TIGR00730 family)